MSDNKLIDPNYLAEIEKPHEVRPIDANALSAYLKETNWGSELLNIIDNTPTVEINDKSLEIARKSIELGRKVGKLEGKLERPQGDLISRSALKEQFEDRTLEDFTCYHFIEAVDNAPTVEPFEPDYVGAERLKARQRGYEEGYHNGMEIGKTLNPKIKQGEWIHYLGCGVGKAMCSECGQLEESKNYCGNCGADMRGKEE